MGDAASDGRLFWRFPHEHRPFSSDDDDGNRSLVCADEDRQHVLQLAVHFVHNASTIVASIAASFLYMFSQGNAAAGSGYATETYIGMYLIEAALMPIGLYMGSRLLMYQQTKSEGFFPKERRKKTIAKIVIPTILLILGGLFFLGIGMM